MPSQVSELLDRDITPEDYEMPRTKLFELRDWMNHHKAIGSISGPNGVTSRADWDEVNAAPGRVVASVPKAKVMAVYDAVKDITDPKVPAYMKSLVNCPDAEK
ncbi:unnamed protein product, partial [Symbiodinium microadriaticum]